MKVSVLGAGAVGSMFGGLIKHHHPDVEVLLVVRGEHGRAVVDRGAIQLDGPWGRRVVPIDATFDPTDVVGSDVVLVTVKSASTEEAIRSAAPALGDAAVVSLQNGVNDATLGRYVAPERIVTGMTAVNMALVEPGRVSLQLSWRTVVGPSADGVNAFATRRAIEVLRLSRLTIDHHRNVLGVRYNKLATNALGFASCLSRSNFIRDCVCDRDWRNRVGRPLLRECVAVFAAAGITPARFPGGPSAKGLGRLLRLLNTPVLGAGMNWAARQLYDRRPILFSLAQDLERGKPTEVDFINGEIVRLAERHGLPTPVNARVVELCHELERRGSGAAYDRDEVVARIAEPPGPANLCSAA